MAKYPKGTYKTRLYHIWKSMKERCYTKGNKNYTKYGAKGITVCGEWKNNYLSFYRWSIENGYKEDLTIDRINNAGNYEPSNCRWTTANVQANNKSNNVILVLNGVSHTMKEWSYITGIKEGTLWYRKEKGWSDEQILTTPILIKCDKRFTKEQVLEMKKEYANGSTYKEIGKRYGVGAGTVCQIVIGNRYKRYFE